MGFSVEQARVALASTDTGLDVEAALETLLANAGPSDPAPRHVSLTFTGTCRIDSVHL